MVGIKGPFRLNKNLYGVVFKTAYVCCVSKKQIPDK